MDIKQLAASNRAARLAAVARLWPTMKAAKAEHEEIWNKRHGIQERKTQQEIVSQIHAPGFFPTPPQLVRSMLDLAGIIPGLLCLEPSAGKGDIADALKLAGCAVEVCEVNYSLQTILKSKGYPLVCADFLDLPVSLKYDRVLMNPPFEHGQDRQHIQRAFEFLKPGGRLVAICSAGPFFRSFKADKEFQAWLARLGAVIHDNPPDSFKCSERPTGVQTKTIVIEKR